MFGMVVLFGLIHGLLFLTVLLSLFGPTFADDDVIESGADMKTAANRIEKKETGSTATPNGSPSKVPLRNSEL